jgi:hypothetical protein
MIFVCNSQLINITGSNQSTSWGGILEFDHAAII